MDDRTFDQKTAQEWISGIESRKSGLRDNDIYPRLKTWVDTVNPSKILEIGAGQGVCSEHLGLKDQNYTGLEPSPFLLNRAKELYSSKVRHFVLGDVYAMPFPESAFDAVFSVAVWHLLGNLKKAASELSRVLKAGGHFLIITANPGAYSLWTDLYADFQLNGRRLEGTLLLKDGSTSQDVLYLHELEEILASLQAENLSLQRTETFRRAEKSDGKDYFLLLQGRKEPENK